MKYRLLLFFIGLISFTCNTSSKKEKQEERFSFTPVTACIFSEIAYCNQAQDTLNKYLPGWKIVWSPTAVNGNYAFVATDGTNYALAIRGSLLQFSWDAFDNWVKQDLNVATQVDWKFTASTTGAKVSQGAYEGWKNMNELKDKQTGKTLWQFLDSATTTNTSFLITGHSLGGNLGSIYASWLSWNFKKTGKPRNNINVITFAAPAAGNEAFADDFNKKFPQSMRIENINDMVPKFPVAKSVGDLGKLYTPLPAASEIVIRFNFLRIKLSTSFSTLEITLKGLELVNGNSVYTQTNGIGYPLAINLSGKNISNDVSGWFAEAGYQHGVVQYAAALGAPVIQGQ